MNHSRQILSRKQSNNYVDMIRHNAPREQPVPFPVKVTQGVCQILCNNWILQVTGACAIVQKLFNNRRRESLDFSPLVAAQGAV